MAIIKLISDFDGIWTNQETEADYVRKYITKKIAEYTSFELKEIDELFSWCRKEMDKSPYEFGWMYNGYTVCYYQEDPFGDNNAIFDYIDRYSNKSSYIKYKQRLAEMKAVVLKKTNLNSMLEFSNRCFLDSTTEFKLGGKLKPDPDAGSVIKELNKRSIEIVVVSNSKTEKIEHLFRKAGHKVTNEKSIVRGKLHATGDAQKFVIDRGFTDVPEILPVTKKFRPELRRRKYFGILLEEKPDYVIGDVFSLDLALPVYLMLNDSRFSKMKVIQKIQPHTPAWVAEYLSSKELKGIAFMINSIDELPSLIK